MNKYGLNIRFLAQGMIKLDPEQLPPGFFEKTREEQIKWVNEFWGTCDKETLMKALAYIDIDEDSVPDCLEVESEDYPIIAQTPAWKAFNASGSQNLSE